MKQVYHFLMILFIICFTTNLYSQSVPSYVPTNGLVGWWGFNGNAQDGSGNGNHGTVNGATLTTDRFGNQNGAYSFDGINNSITVADNQSLRPSTISISVWVLSNNFINDGGCIISKTQPGTAQGEQYILGHDNLGSANFQIKRNSGCAPGVNWQYLNTSQNTILNSNWEHIVCTYDGITMKFYKGSALINSFVPQPGGIDNCAGGSLNIGRYWQSQFHYNGKIDDIGIWNRALTQYEITNLHNSQLPTQTSLCLPTITTNTPTSIGIDSVLIGGNITNDGGSSIVLRGVCYSTTPNPNMGNMRAEDGSGVGSFSTILRNLIPSTTYYVRSYAKNSQGVVVYGNDVSFSTGTPIPGMRCPGTPSVTDIDGNLYYTVQIGTQCWTQSNLKASKYRNGDNIPTGLSNSAWENTTAGAYAIYNNDPVNDGLYGKLYNHYAVMDTRGLCPTGWHVPTDGEWSVLENFLGGYILSENAAEMLKGPAQGDWNRPNSGVTNSTGFTALPGGLRYGFGAFANIGGYSGFWSSSNTGLDAWNRGLGAGRHPIERSNYSRNNGFSIRCLKDSIIMPFSCGMSTISDIDGNNYNTVQIGMQCWTQSNLKVSKYRNGDNIPTGLSNSAWGSTTAGAYVIYDNNWPNFGLYGLLYNHFAVIDSRGLCPTGWHIPTDNEWNVLVKYLDPNSDTFAIGSQNTTAGGMLRSTLTQPTPGGWSSPNLGATNSSGFTAEPGGFRWQSYGMMSVGTHGLWWSSSISITEAWHRSMNFSDVSVSRNTNPQNNGFSVRCLRD
jgi:uncharacterized protein (TIGR02145 family)